MKEKLFYDFEKLTSYEKKDIILEELFSTIELIEKICQKKKIKIEKLKSQDVLINKTQLYEADYLRLMFIYITYLQEDLGLLLSK